MTRIIDNIYLGSIKHTNELFFTDANIGLIINVAYECEYESKIPQLKFKLHDSYTQKISEYFDYIVDTLKHNKNNKTNTLIHCFAGRSRSASFVLAYLVKEHKMPLKDAFEYLLKLSDIYPNLSFVGELMEYEKKTLNVKESSFDYDTYAVTQIFDTLCSDKKITLEQVRKTYYDNNKDVDTTYDKLFLINLND